MRHCASFLPVGVWFRTEPTPVGACVSPRVQLPDCEIRPAPQTQQQRSQQRIAANAQQRERAAVQEAVQAAVQVA